MADNITLIKDTFMTIPTILEKLYQGQYITFTECEILFNAMIQKTLSPLKIASLLISMKIRGESPKEISSAANILLKHSKPFPRPKYLFADISGTGGDFNNTINISTISAIVAATCGLKIAKHGNHNISSKSGSADLISKFNIPLNTSPQKSLQTLKKFGICFLYAQQYHPNIQYLSRIRRDLKTPTLLNILGPLINPSKPPLAIIGVYKKELLLPVAQSLKELKYHHTAMVVHCDGIDEIGLHAPTQIAEFYKGNIQQYTLTPQDFGLKYQKKETLLGGSPQKNYNITLNLLQGKGKPEHEFVIAANVAVLLKLFGNQNLIENTHHVLDIIHQKKAYECLLSFKNNYN